MGVRRWQSELMDDEQVSKHGDQVHGEGKRPNMKCCNFNSSMRLPEGKL